MSITQNTYFLLICTKWYLVNLIITDKHAIFKADFGNIFLASYVKLDIMYTFTHTTKKSAVSVNRLHRTVKPNFYTPNSVKYSI